MRLALAASRRTARSGFGEESSPSHLRGLYKRGFTTFELALSNTEGQHTKCMQMLCYGISLTVASLTVAVRTIQVSLRGR